MKYIMFAEVYDEMSKTTKRLQKAQILAEFLKKLPVKDAELFYLLQGRVFPSYDSREFGISTQLILKCFGGVYGLSEKDMQTQFSTTGDLGDIAFSLSSKKKQSTLFNSALEAEYLVEKLRSIEEIEGKGSVDKKLAVITELLSQAGALEARYLIRTLMGDLRIGVADSLLLDAINSRFFEGDKEKRELLEEKYGLINDFAAIYVAASKGEKALKAIKLIPGKPTQVMLPIKVTSIDEAFEICGRPAAFEHKYDGFRVLINKNKGEVNLFTRKMENVTEQFPDVIEAVKKYVKGESFILDSEVVGYDAKTKKYKPFEAISQRIRRKYSIEELQKELPVEINIFDVLYYEGENTIDLPFRERRKIIEGIISVKPLCIRPAHQKLITSDEEALEFYEQALEIGEEGVMVKKIDASYKQGRYVGHMVKLKPVAQDLDLVIVGAEHGTGKRAGWLSSYIVACKEGEKFVEIGKVASGLKEKEEEGFTFEEMTRLLKPLATGEKDGIVSVKPKIVVSVTYQNMQPSTSYSSGYALRFPRITHYRPDRKTDDIATLSDVKKLMKEQKK